ncbi:hypothetical protein F4604DRAFT_1926069 [Suillus subluteus]|nr:hypothetical protein F4604DRAFT_1926069 [Suillus subluteus]
MVYDKDLTLLITRNKYYWPVLFEAGVLGPRTNLDEPASKCCCEHTEALVEEVTLGDLWDEYGIVSDLIYANNTLWPFTNDFPRVDIHELIAPDLLHQLIKGTFKDHIVDWVEKYLHQTHGKTAANHIMDDINRRIAATPSFAGLRRFPQGCGFKQWTGNDSKALMKVYLPAIEGHVPIEVVQTFRAFLEFCYLVRRNVITEKTLDKIQDALDRFHWYREVFKTTEIIETFSLPCQHSLQHYICLIRLFGAPNGLCSSITESKHIKRHYEPTLQIAGCLMGRAFRQLSMHQIRIANDEPGNPLQEDTEPEVNVWEDEDVSDVEIDTGLTILQAHVELAKMPRSSQRRQHLELNLCRVTVTGIWRGRT